MSLLCDREWKLKYTPDDGDLVNLFYVPALECAVRYDRLTGYFQAKALGLAARGIEGLVEGERRWTSRRGRPRRGSAAAGASRDARKNDRYDEHHEPVRCRFRQLHADSESGLGGTADAGGRNLPDRQPGRRHQIL